VLLGHVFDRLGWCVIGIAAVPAVAALQRLRLRL
jgi:hypothetical protein